MKIKILLLSITFIFLSYSFCTQPNWQEMATLESFLEAHDFSGSILIAKKGNIIFKKSFGYANFEDKTPNTEHTKFCIGSLTKTVTAAAIMKLQEQRLLNVNDPIGTFITDFPCGDFITIHDLLTHTSGIPDFTRDMDFYNCTGLEEMITYCKHKSFIKSERSYHYSNYGYFLLAYIIQKVSGKSYEQFITEALRVPFATGEHRAIGYEFASEVKCAGEVKKRAPIFEHPLTLLGNGNLAASLEDMYAWDQALFSGNIIAIESLNTMLTPHIMMKDSQTRFHGYGFFIDTINGKRVAEYSGYVRGFLSKHIHFLDEDITIIVLSNVADVDSFIKMCDAIPAIVFNL